MIEVKNISKSFNNNVVMQNFSYTFREGTATCIMGPSGCGKTTLLKIIMGLENPDAGSVINTAPKFSAVFQEDRLFEDFSAMANLRAVTSAKYSRDRLQRELESIGLDDDPKKPVKEYSGGMKRRVAIVRAMLADSNTVILDEPFKGLDEANREKSAEYILKMLNGRTLIFVSHDPSDAALLAADILEIA